MKPLLENDKDRRSSCTNVNREDLELQVLNNSEKKSNGNEKNLIECSNAENVSGKNYRSETPQAKEANSTQE